MKRILSMFLIFSLFLGCSLPNSYASNQENIGDNINNYKSMSKNGERAFSYDSKINKIDFHYDYKIKNNEVKITIIGNNNIDNLSINKEKNTLIINGKNYKLDEVIKMVNNNTIGVAKNTIPKISASSATLCSPESLSYNYMGTTNYVVDLAVISGSLIAVSVVAGIICGMLTYNIGVGMKITDLGIKVSRVSYYISFLAPGAAYFVGNEKICYKIEQFNSTTRALVDPMHGVGYVFKNNVMFFKDNSFRSAISGWELAGYFQ